MSAPTLWQEGHWSGGRVIRLSLLVSVVSILLSLAVHGRLGLVYGVSFVALCVAAALLVRPHDFFDVGVLPPLLLLGACFLLSAIHRGAVGAPGDGFVQGLVSGLAHNATALALGYGLALAVLAIRTRVLRRVAEQAADPTVHSKREASPAPYRVISGAPEEKSTTVVGDDPHSPESMTASNS